MTTNTTTAFNKRLPWAALGICVLVVTSAGCLAPHSCRETAPWSATWTQPGLFQNVTSTLPGYTETRPPTGQAIAPEYDRFKWGPENFRMTTATLLVSNTGNSYEVVNAYWDGSIYANLRATRTDQEVAQKLRVINDVLFRFDDATFDALQARFLASRLVSASEPEDVAEYRANANASPAYGAVLHVLQGYDALKAPRGSLDPGQAAYQIGPAWILVFELATKTFTTASGETVSVDAKDRASTSHRFPNAPTEERLREAVAPDMASAGIQPSTFMDIEPRGTLLC